MIQTNPSGQIHSHLACGRSIEGRLKPGQPRMEAGRQAGWGGWMEASVVKCRHVKPISSSSLTVPGGVGRLIPRTRSPISAGLHHAFFCSISALFSLVVLVSCSFLFLLPSSPGRDGVHSLSRGRHHRKWSRTDEDAPVTGIVQVNVARPGAAMVHRSKPRAWGGWSG